MPASDREQRKVAERRARALAMKAAGATNRQIMDQSRRWDKLPAYSAPAAVAQDITRALQAISTEDAGLTQLRAALELVKLDQAEQAANQIRVAAQTGGDPDTALRAIDRILRIGVARARLTGQPATVGSMGGEPGPIDELARRRATRRNRFRPAR